MTTTFPTAHLADLKSAKTAIMHDIPLTIDQRIAVLEVIGIVVDNAQAVGVGWFGAEVLEDVGQE